MQLERPLVAGVVTLSVIAIAAWVFQDDGELPKVEHCASRNAVLRGASEGDPLLCRGEVCMAVPRAGAERVARQPFRDRAETTGAGPKLLAAVNDVARHANYYQTTDNRWAVLGPDVWDMARDEVAWTYEEGHDVVVLGNFLFSHERAASSEWSIVDPVTRAKRGPLVSGRMDVLDDHTIAIEPQIDRRGTLYLIDAATLAQRTVEIPDVFPSIQEVERLDDRTIVALIGMSGQFQGLVWIDEPSLRIVAQRRVPAVTEMVSVR